MHVRKRTVSATTFPGPTRQLVRKAGFVNMAGIALYVDMNSAMRGRGAESGKLQASVTLATDSGWMTANPETIRGQRSRWEKRGLVEGRRPQT